jgi:2-polyprenyl-3-methyl-5-hydroxy-6-metoxy-1,4-benzoquinol methylase
MTDEQRRVDAAAGWYVHEQLDLDRRMVGYRYAALRPHLRGPAGLELGPADGEMTLALLAHFESLTVVDAAGTLLDRVPARPGLRKVHALFERFEPSDRYDSIVMEHVLEHVADPVALLSRAREWLTPGGCVLAGVPNANSLHRLAAVKMGLLAAPEALNDRDRRVGHRRVYTPESLAADVEAGGLRIIARGGVFLKPLANSQIESSWDERMIEGFHQLGRDMPELAAEIFVVCEPARSGTRDTDRGV